MLSPIVCIRRFSITALAALAIFATSARAGGHASSLGLPYPAAWTAEQGADARRDEARRLFLALLEHSISSNSTNQERQLARRESEQKAISRFTIYLFYAQAYRASLVPENAAGVAREIRGRYIDNARRALLTFATATRTDRKAQADQNEFSQAACVQLYEELVRLGALNEKQKSTVLAALGDGAQAVLELKAERGSFNRGAYVAAGLAQTARLLPDDPRAGAWRRFATDYWELDWMREKDTIEDARGYNGLWIYATFHIAKALGRTDDLRDPDVQKTFFRFTHMVTPNGFMPDFGNSYWWHGLEHWVCAAEMVGAFYQRSDFLDNSTRLARFLINHPECDLGEMEALVDVCKIIAPSAAPLPPRPRAVVTTRRTDYGDVVHDKLYLRTGDTPDASCVCVDLHDAGYHGHSDGGTIALYSKGPHVLLHTLGRLETFANQHQGVWSAKTAAELLADGSSQYRAGEWNRWLLNFRWPGTHMGALTIDPSHVRRIFFRVSDPEKLNGDATLEAGPVLGVRPDGSTAVIHPGWSGKKTFSTAKANEAGFIGSRDALAITDWSAFTHLLVTWKSNVPAEVGWFGIDAAAYNASPEKTGSLRVRASSRTLSAHVNPDAAIAAGGFKREMLDASGRRVFHWRDLRLNEKDGMLVVLDSFEFTEDGDYVFGPVWHAQNVIKRTATNITVRDDVQFQNNRATMAQPPADLRFDFAATANFKIVSNTHDYKNTHPQKEHFSAACEGPRKAGERVTIVSVLRPTVTQEIELRIKLGAARITTADGRFDLAHPDF